MSLPKTMSSPQLLLQTTVVLSLYTIYLADGFIFNDQINDLASTAGYNILAQALKSSLPSLADTHHLLPFSSMMLPGQNMFIGRHGLSNVGQFLLPGSQYMVRTQHYHPDFLAHQLLLPGPFSAVGHNFLHNIQKQIVAPVNAIAANLGVLGQNNNWDRNVHHKGYEYVPQQQNNREEHVQHEKGYGKIDVVPGDQRVENVVPQQNGVSGKMSFIHPSTSKTNLPEYTVQVQQIPNAGKAVMVESPKGDFSDSIARLIAETPSVGNAVVSNSVAVSSGKSEGNAVISDSTAVSTTASEGKGLVVQSVAVMNNDEDIANNGTDGSANSGSNETPEMKPDALAGSEMITESENAPMVGKDNSGDQTMPAPNPLASGIASAGFGSDPTMAVATAPIPGILGATATAVIP